VNQDGNRINIKTVNLDAHNGALCHDNKDTLLSSCCCLHIHNRVRRVMTINEVDSVGYNSCEQAEIPCVNTILSWENWIFLNQNIIENNES